MGLRNTESDVKSSERFSIGFASWAELGSASIP
jgi:hypothetical protein